MRWLRDSLIVLLLVCVVSWSVAADPLTGLVCRDNFTSECIEDHLLGELPVKVGSGLDDESALHILSVLSDLNEDSEIWNVPGFLKHKASYFNYLGVSKSLPRSDGALLNALTDQSQTQFRQLLLVKYLQGKFRQSGFNGLLSFLKVAKLKLDETDYWRAALYTYYRTISQVRLDLSVPLESELIQTALAAQEKEHGLILDVAYAAILGGDSEKGRELIFNLAVASDTAVPILKRREMLLLLSEFKSRSHDFYSQHADGGEYGEIRQSWQIAFDQEQRAMLRRIEAELDLDTRISAHQLVAEMVYGGFAGIAPMEAVSTDARPLAQIHLFYSYLLLINKQYSQESAHSSLEHHAKLLSLVKIAEAV